MNNEKVSNVAVAEAPAIATINKVKIINYFAAITQFLTWPFVFTFFHVFYRISVNGRDNIKNLKGPFMIIANHISMFDSFSFRLVLGFWTKNLPLRFMGVRKFNSGFLNFLKKIGIVDLVYSLFGVFVVVPGIGLEENIKTPIRIIKNGGNVVVYPEGQIYKGDKIAEFKRGASVLAERTGVPILPVSFRINGEEGQIRKRFIINIGSPLTLIGNESESQITTIFYNSVNNLFAKR